MYGFSAGSETSSKMEVENSRWSCSTHCYSALVWGALVLIFRWPLSGADLLVEQLGPGAGDQKKENPNVFLVGSTWKRLLSGAEDVGLFKEYNDGSMRGFTCANKNNFTNFTGEVPLISVY